MQVVTIGLDLAKHWFQAHGVDAAGAAILRKRLKRSEVLAFFRDIEPCLVGMEACASSHYWAREISGFGHTVRLMPPAYVKPYVKRGKNDAADAEAICEAVTRPNMRFVAIKTPEQQGALMLHRARRLLVRQRTMTACAIRSHLAEFGFITGQGKGVDGWNRAQPVQGPTPVDALVNGKKLRRGLKLWTVSVSTWKADLYRRLWLGRGDADEFPPGWVHLPRAIEPEWVKQFVAEQLRTVKDRRGFARQEWAKLRERNEALDCAVLARAALWLLGADRYGERFWQQLRGQVADAPLRPTELPTGGNIAPPSPPPETGPAMATRPSKWLAPRGGWLR